jgi:hypothetical protein
VTQLHSSNLKIGTIPLANAVKLGVAILGIEFAIMLVIEGVFVPLFGDQLTPFF